LLQTVVVVATTAWAIRADWPVLQHLDQLEAPALAVASASVVRGLGVRLALMLLALGLVDFALQYGRIEDLLRTTPEQHREDLRAVEGDPALRTRRRQMARSWRGDSAELLAGASLVLTGPTGLCVVLAGGPPPRRISVRSVAQGTSGSKLQRSAESAQIPQIAAPKLARQIAQRRAPALPLAPEIVAELSAVWPTSQRS
jgi:flagellar biosynthetic protein FlhB